SAETRRQMPTDARYKWRGEEYVTIRGATQTRNHHGPKYHTSGHRRSANNAATHRTTTIATGNAGTRKCRYSNCRIAKSRSTENCSWSSRSVCAKAIRRNTRYPASTAKYPATSRVNLRLHPRIRNGNVTAISLENNASTNIAREVA